MKRIALLVVTAALSVGAVQTASAAALPAAGVDAHAVKVAHHRHHHRHHHHRHAPPHR